MDYYSNLSNTKVRDLQDAKQFKFNDEKVQTTTSKEQVKENIFVDFFLITHIPDHIMNDFN